MDYVHKGFLDIKFVDIDQQWADIFTKLLSKDKFNYIKEFFNIPL